jgi:hypothetical protein
MVTYELEMAVRHRAGVYHTHLRRSGTEGRRPNSCRSSESTAVRPSSPTKVIQALLSP